MNSLILHDGKIIQAGEFPRLQDSGRNAHGEGLFETLLWDDNRIFFRNAHMARLRKGMDVMGLRLPESCDDELLCKEMQRLAENNEHQKARIRLRVFRNDTGDPAIGNASYLIESEPFDIPPHRTYSLMIYADEKKTADALSRFKNCNYYPYDSAAGQAGAAGYDDAIVLNDSGNVCDSSRANVFIIKGEDVFTPPLSEGCIAGIFREYLIRSLQSDGQSVSEKPIRPEELSLADEIFLTNSVRGIMPVHALDGTPKITVRSLALALRFPLIGESLSDGQE